MTYYIALAIAPVCSVTVNSGHALLTAAQAGLGLIVQPAILLADDLKTGRLVQLFPDWQLRERYVSLLYYRDQRMTPRMRSFIAFSLTELRPMSDNINSH